MTDQYELTPNSRICIFVDYWNLQLTMNGMLKDRKIGEKFFFDWISLPGWLAKQAVSVCGLNEYTYEGMYVYSSYNPASGKDNKYKRWVETWLDRQPGVQVSLRERQRRRPLDCQHCDKTVDACPHCKQKINRTEEKGVDTAIATDMIRLAWEQVYDIGILVSSDADLVPAVEFLSLRGRKIVQAGFPPKGSALATACWASFDLFERRAEFER